ncbi:MAG: glycosyl hydrolase [Saprospiraceae bacterium]|nr:glycosyl hydrolase [Saprospiraceae bacterium]
MLDATNLTTQDLRSKLDRFWKLAGDKILLIDQEFDSASGAPVFTVNGKYGSRGWTEWTQGFQYGAAIIQFEVSGDERFLDLGRDATIQRMAPHVTHFGVHDHGFNNVSTYGNLHRLIVEGKIDAASREKELYELALKLSGSVQAHRWTDLPAGGGYIYSFNGPHSLFVDTIRSVRALIVSHELGHDYRAENDKVSSLLDKALDHAVSTAAYSVYYGEGRDTYDVEGRTAHESVFNLNDGRYRCPNSQQGFSGFTTWTRGLAWAMLGFAEQLEYLDTLSSDALDHRGGLKKYQDIFLKAAQATCNFYINYTPPDGIPYWDTGAPDLHMLGDYLSQPADPFNDFEPVDSSAAAIGAQGLLRLGKYLNDHGEDGDRYWQAGLHVANRLLEEPYLSVDPGHQGLILHSIYHRPNGWDHIPTGKKQPCGESSMWGDYHAMELCLYLHGFNHDMNHYTFFNGVKNA